VVTWDAAEKAIDDVEDGMGVLGAYECGAWDIIDEDDVEWMGLGGGWYECTVDGTELRAVYASGGAGLR
jgi:hypothetical protein